MAPRRGGYGCAGRLPRLASARVKAGGAIPLPEPELSLASLLIPRMALEKGLLILGEPVRSTTSHRLP